MLVIARPFVSGLLFSWNVGSDLLLGRHSYKVEAWSCVVFLFISVLSAFVCPPFLHSVSPSVTNYIKSPINYINIINECYD